MEKFNVHICVTSSAKLATIMSVLDGEAKLISVEQVEDKPRRKNLITRHRLNGTRAVDIALELAKGGSELPIEKVERALMDKGLSKNSAAPRLSELVANGQLVLIRKGVYKIAPKAK